MKIKIFSIIFLIFQLMSIDALSGTTEFISTSNEGLFGNGSSRNLSISKDERFVVFESWSTNLVPGDTNDKTDIFVRDRISGTIKRISVSSDGDQGNGHSETPTISADGQYIVFSSEASNLVAGDSNGHRDVFVHDCITGTTKRISVANDGSEGSEASGGGDGSGGWGYGIKSPISDDGRYIVFESRARNFYPEKNQNSFNYESYIYDRDTDKIKWIPNQDYYHMVPSDITGDGRYILVSSDAYLTENKTWYGTASYVFDTNNSTFDLVGNGLFPLYSYNCRISDDGDSVILIAQMDINGFYNVNYNVFVYKRSNRSLKYVNVSSDGDVANGSSDGSDNIDISSDGRYTVFISNATNLDQNYHNNTNNLFFHDTMTGETKLVNEVSVGAGTASISGSGRFVAYSGIPIANPWGGEQVMVSDMAAPATITLSGLYQTYDGSLKAVTATTDPPGLTVNITYDGRATVPTNADSYTVVATINEATYQGSASETLVIAKAPAQFNFTGLDQIYDGAPKEVTVTTLPAGLAFDITYDGYNTTPTNAGSYTVATTITDPNYQGSANTTLNVAKAPATVTFSGLNQTYTGALIEVTSMTVPAGLTVGLTYSGTPMAPRDAGSYAVAATVNDLNYEGGANGTLNVAKATVTITLSGLNQTYDGSSKVVTATTDPAGLTVDVLYDVNATNAGSYPVSAIVTETNYQGSTSGTLVIAKAHQTIDNFYYPATPKKQDIVTLSAIASSGLPVTFTVTSGLGMINGSTLTFTGKGVVTITASQTGNNNYIAAADVQGTILVQ